MTVQTNLETIFKENKSTKAKIAALASYIADERVSALYYVLQLQRAKGPKWVEENEAIKKMAHGDFGSEPEDIVL